MTRKNSIKLGRQPPDEALLIEIPGIKIRLSGWGIAVVLILCLVLLSPEDIGSIIAIFGSH